MFSISNCPKYFAATTTTNYEKKLSIHPSFMILQFLLVSIGYCNNKKKKGTPEDILLTEVQLSSQNALKTAQESDVFTS